MRKLVLLLAVSFLGFISNVASASVDAFSESASPYDIGKQRQNSGHIIPARQFADIHLPGGIAIGIGNICAPFAVDNGCTNRASGINTGRQPGYQDTNMIVDSAASGQLGTGSGDPNYAVYLAARIAFYRQFNEAIPGIDYPNGSQDPSDSGSGGSSLTPIYLLNVDPARGDCNYYPSGNVSPANPFPTRGGVKPNFVYCLATGSNRTSTIANYDFSNTGSGTGTDFVLVWLVQNGGFANTTVNFNNDYNKCVGGYCSGSSAGVGIASWVDSQKAASGASWTNVNFTNITFDGDFFNVYTSTSLIPVTQLWDDQRGDASQGNYNFSMTNVVMENAGGTLATGNSGGIASMNYVNAVRVCMSGFGGCHGEFAELARATGYRPHLTVSYVGDVWLTGSYGHPGCVGACDPGGEMTTPFYLTSGGGNGLIIDSAVVSYPIIFGNYGFCNGTPTPGNFPFSPNNVCVSSGSAGVGNSGILDTGWNPYIASLSVDHVLGDIIGTSTCYSNSYGSSSVYTLTINIPGGTTFNITSPNVGTIGSGNLAAFKNVTWLWSGNGIHDITGGLGFTDTFFLPPASQTGTEDPFAKFLATSAVAGTMTTDSPQQLEVGQAVIQDINTGNALGYVSSGCPGSCLSVGTAVSGSSFQLTTTSGGSTVQTTTFVHQNVRSFNNTGNGIGGQNPDVGTLIMNASEPAIGVVAASQRWGSFAYIQSSSFSNNYYIFGQISSGLGTLMTFADLLAPGSNPKSCT